MKIRENKLLGVYVDGVKKHLVTSFEQIEAVMDMGTKYTLNNSQKQNSRCNSDERHELKSAHDNYC